MADSGESPLSEVLAADAALMAEEEYLTAKLPSSRPTEEDSQGSDEPWVRAIACLCFEVNGPEPQGWRAGPLPVCLPNGRQADREARATYFHARAADSLYGPPDGSSPTRWHRTGEEWPDQAVLVRVIELLRFPRYTSALQTRSRRPNQDGQQIRYLAVIHLSLPVDALLSELAAAVRLNPSNSADAVRRQRYAELIGTGFEVSPQVRRALSVVMLTWKDKLRSPKGAPPEWSPTNSWLWCAATAAPFKDFCPDVDDPHLLDGMVYLSASWRALVLRDGIAFLGLTAEAQVSDNNFFAWGESYVRSLYTDVVLLATFERDALDDFADRLARIGNRFEKSVEFRSLVNEVTEFRNVFWWDHVTRHGVANNILRQLHDAHRTPQAFARVIADLDAFRQQVEAQALEASLRLQTAEERRSRKFEHAASIAAFAFGLPVLIFAALAVPIRGITSGDHSIPGWAVIFIALASIVFGAISGAAGSRWLSKRDG
jgi:hypothetical protein